MAKKDLFKEALELGLIPEDAKDADYTVKQLEEILAEAKKTETSKEVAEVSKTETLFEKAVRMKAVPVGAKEENYAEAHLKMLIQKKEEADVEHKRVEDFEKEIKSKSKKEKSEE